MVEVNYQNFSLDIDKAASKNLNQVVTGRLGDHLLTGIIVSTLENDKSFDLTGYTIRFEGTTSEGTVVVDADNVEIVDLKAGKFKYTFSNKVFSVLDQYQTAYFAFEKADRRATSENFIISVIQDVDVTWEEAQSYISILNALIRKFNTEWDEFKTDKTKSFDDFVETKETQYQQLTNTANQLGIDFGKLQSSVTQLQKDVPALESKATQLSKDLTALDTKSKNVSTAFDTTKKNVDALDVTVADLTKRSTDLKTETTSLEGQVSKLKTDTSSLEQKTKDIQQIQTDLAADVNEVSKAIEDNDVYRKAETFNQQQDGVNVLDIVSGTKPTLYSETLIPDGEQATGSIFVKDMGVENEILNTLPEALPKHRNQAYASTNKLSSSISGAKFRLTVNANTDPYYRPVAGSKGETLKSSTKYTLAFKYNVLHGTFLRIRCIMGGKHITNFYEGNGFAIFSFTTGQNEAQYISFDPVREKTGGGINSSQVGDWFELEELQLVEGEYTELPYRPAPEDLGIVHGQPNIFTGAASSSEWKTSTFSGYFPGGLAQTYVVGKDIAVGDIISSSIEIDNTLEGSVTYLTSQATVIKNDSSPTAYPESGTIVNVGETKTSILSYKVQSNDAEIKMKLAMKNPQETTSFRYRNAQIIKGTSSLLGEWKPAQQNSGLTIVNGGMVPFNSDQYSALADPLKCVRAETNIVGAGAGIELEFPVLDKLSRKYPYLNLTTETLKKNITTLKTPFSARGRGRNTSGNIGFFAGVYVRNLSGGWWGVNAINYASDFVEMDGTGWTATHIEQLTADGKYIFKATAASPVNNSPTSDGVTTSWIELKHISLIVELEINGKTVVEEIVAKAVKPLQILLNQAIDRIEQLEGGN